MTPSSILVIGATGRTGVEVIRQLSENPANPTVAAFGRSASKLSDSDKRLCDYVIEGDALKPSDIEEAITSTKANVVIVSVGIGDSVARTDVRTKTAEALATVLRKPGFEHVHVVIISSTGSGGSKIKVGYGIGKLISIHLRHVLKDHDGQEATFAQDSALSDRTLIVRATALVDDKAQGNVITFGDKDKSPTIQTDRSDLAMWVVDQVCNNAGSYGKAINVTAPKKQ